MAHQNNISTEWNSNLYRTLSLNQLLDQAVDYSRLASNKKKVDCLKMWHVTLITIHDEIEPKMLKPEKLKAQKMFNKLKEIGSVIIKKSTPEGKINVVDRSRFVRHWSHLNKIGRLLRKVADSKGMLLTNKTMDSEIGEF